MNSRPTYIVAVSGGVDSIVLLHKLVKVGKARLIVAHFDHGIRSDSADDRRFVQDLAKKYDLPFEYAEGKLGPDASEAKARTARYEFLDDIKKKYNADAVVTAHHQDDVIETAIINILRGTKSRGLSSLNSRPGLIRPLLKYTKFTIVKYAITHQLTWREDPSNQDTKYLRNYIRLVLIPKLDKANPAWRNEFLERINQAGQLNKSIEPLLGEIEPNIAVIENDQIIIKRSKLVNLPGEVGREFMGRWIKKLDRNHKIDRQLVKRAWLFAKTAESERSLNLSKNLAMRIENGQVVMTGSAK